MNIIMHQRLAIDLTALVWSVNALCMYGDGSSTLHGDRGGLRRRKTEQGANFEAVYNADFISSHRRDIECSADPAPGNARSQGC